MRTGGFRTIAAAWGLAAWLAGPALGDGVLVAVNTNGQLAVSPSGLIPSNTYSSLLPSTGLLKGWTNTNPGFDHLVVEESQYGLAPLQAGAAVWLEVVALDPAFRAIDNGFQVLDQPGDDTLLGGSTFHQHITWHINSQDAAFDPAQCVWGATFLLRDDGATNYAPSAPLGFRFTNVPLRHAQAPVPPATGDFDQSGTVDLADYAAFAECLGGVGQAPQPDDPAITTCEVECVNAFDFDNDLDVDLADYAALQRELGS